jgi:hypothetical protein
MAWIDASQGLAPLRIVPLTLTAPPQLPCLAVRTVDIAARMVRAPMREGSARVLYVAREGSGTWPSWEVLT